MATIKENIQFIQNRIIATAQQCDRDPNTIKLIAVSKTKPTHLIEEAILSGQTLFGENYVQEGTEKIHYFKASLPNTSLEWHFIGALQSNKTKLVAENFDWVHTVDRLKIAQRLSEQRPDHLPKLNVLIQVNISLEETKSGIKPDEISELAREIALLPNLKLRGLMAIPKIVPDYEGQLEIFNKMHLLYQELQHNIAGIDTLSMGMTDDMDAAIIAGSTMIRIGTAIFGAREYN